MARIALLVHVDVEVDDADVVAWESPESCTPTALRRLLQAALAEYRVLHVPQTPAVGVLDVESLRVEWPGDHALRVVSQIREGLFNAQELGIGAVGEERPGRGRSHFRRELGG